MDQIDELLTRRVEEILPTKEKLKQTITEKGKIRLYQGFDPTGGRLHLGHAIGLKKLMEFAKAGHEVIFLFGTGTVLVGDPSERDTGRKLITQEEIEDNIKGWKDQVKSIVDFDLVTIRQNGDWLVPLTLKEIIKIAANISAVQLFKRDSFQRRIDKGDTVWYHETMYPLLQGYDSVVMDVDLEIGGTDQTFNMLVGRELQRKINHREKYVLSIPMILGTDGRQMSKTSGNCIWLNDTPQDMFGKVMSLVDEQIVPYFELVTDISINRVKEIESLIASGQLHPMKAKKELAYTIVSEFHSDEDAEAALKHFESTVQARELPQEMTEVTIDGQPISLLELLKLAGLEESNAAIKRTISQGGVEVNGAKLTDPTAVVSPEQETVIKYGKRTFRRIIWKGEA